MKNNEAHLTRCPKCGQNLFETYNSRCYGCGYTKPREDYFEEWVNEDDPWYKDPFEDLD